MTSFLEQKDEASADDLLSQLITEHASPVIKQIVRYKLRRYSGSEDGHSHTADADDLHNEVIVKLLYDLRERRNAAGEKIDDFRGYTAVTTYRACSEYLRRKHPLRHGLKNRLRYALNAHPDLAAWPDASGESVGGFAVWREAQIRATRNDALKKLQADPYELAGALPAGSDFRKMNPAELMAAIFNFAGGPVELDDLVSIVAALHGISERTDSLDAVDEEGRRGYENLKDERADVGQQAVQRDHLRRVWEEICQLPAPQRVALLLNLKDDNGNCVTTLLPVAGVASVRQIAKVLEIPPEEFYRLWGDLPLDDATIANLLGLARQQVINLRKSARERLARRMKAAEK